jgi:hypothetical protein
METKLAKLTPKVGCAPFTKIPTDTQDMKGNFPLWHLKKVSNSEEHCMVEQDSTKYYWYEDGHSFENKSCRMYCMHKPGDGHIAWLAQKEKLKKDNATRVTLPLLCLSHCLLLRHLMQPNLTLVICQSFHF